MKNLRGKEVFKNVRKYRIDWDKKSRSKLQFKVKQFLRHFWSTQMVFEEFPVYGSKMKVDFLNATKRIAIEVNGRQHAEYVPYFHRNSPTLYWAGMQRDSTKEDWLESNGYKLVIIEEEEVEHLSPVFFLENFGVAIT